MARSSYPGTPGANPRFVRVGAALATSAKIDDDGRILFSIRSKTSQLPSLPKDYGADLPEFAVEPTGLHDVPSLNIVIFVVGSRGARFRQPLRGRRMDR